MSNQKSLAFRVDFNSRVRAIKTYVSLFSISSSPPNKGIRIEAIWDTGATNSVITPYVAQQLRLSPIDTVRIKGVNSEADAPVALVHISLPNNLLLVSRRVTIAKIGGEADMLIGMDIISLGDFLISNLNQKTSFSFVIPPFPNQPDWVERSKQINGGIA
jgi:predicted aspartyl protease